MTTKQSEALSQYEHDWRRMLWDATGDQTKVDRIIELAKLNGLFDPVIAALARVPEGWQLVPKEATLDMMAAGGFWMPQTQWASVLEVVPQPPTP